MGPIQKEGVKIMQRSAVEWTQILGADPAAMRNLHQAVTKLAARKRVAEKNGQTFERLLEEWGDGVDVRRALFTRNDQGSTFPKYTTDVSQWKSLIHDFCEWHGITGLDDIVSLWSDVNDTLMTCPDYDKCVNPEFRAWAYGCMCKFILEQRRLARTRVPYSPGHPAL